MADVPEPAAPLVLQTELGSTPQDVRAVLALVRMELTALGWGDTPIGAVELVLAEALNNIVEHACAERSDGCIALALHADAHCAELTLRDDGHAMPDGGLPPGRLALPDRRQDLPEGGFGWYLIRKLSERLHYAREEGGNRLDILICRADHEAPPGTGGTAR
ncbi:ATP-binding protein [Salipiger sp. 1_MG-2023]|uniref:ATP-binding protein n=1 Tax=Salipiger sp. 1_MG-2023 TaxID=3062665 RepID=UPI0026E281A8|nr:ATP-binding protein [Salipiger sp. 1_MG-2023]MDO6585594.1 ATP-binding protein [Salipiger sp. 1_MG-2023]